MTDDKQPRTAKPESLEAKFKLLALLPYDRRAKRKHCLVFGFILDWYHSKYGDALASVRHVTSTIKDRDPFGAGLYAGDVHAALTDLVAWGYLEQEKGIGRRASRYVPVWAKLDSVRENANTTDSEISVRENANTCVRENANATPDSVRDSTNEDPSTVTRPQDGVNGKMDKDCAAPTAPPPAVGLTAPPAAGTAQDETKATTTTTKTGFDELWHAYGRNRQKKEARAAYTKLAPEAELHAEIIESARKWREAWEAQNKPDAPRYSLAKWIEREDFECEPPTAYKPKERKAKDRPDRLAPKSNGKLTDQLRFLESEFIGSPFGDYRLRIRLDGPNGEQEHVLRVLTDAGQGEDNEVFNKIQRAFGSDADDWPSQRLRLEMDGDRIVDIVSERKPDRRVVIAEADIVAVDGDKILVMRMVDSAGKTEGRVDIVFSSDDPDEQAEGQRQLARLFDAVNLQLGDDSESDELIGRVLTLTGSGDFKSVPLDIAEAA